MNDNAYTDSTINITDITTIGERLPVGRYTTRLIACEGKQSKRDKPMVQATWEVVSGEHEGQEIVLFYSLSVTQKKDKRGVLRRYASGVTDCIAALAAAGNPWPENQAFPLDKSVVAQHYARAMRGKHMDVIVTPDAYDQKDENGNPTGKKIETTRAKLARPANGPVQVQQAATGVTATDDLFSDI